jgi:polysaccharide biosynthesis protein PslG
MAVPPRPARSIRRFYILLVLLLVFVLTFGASVMAATAGRATTSTASYHQRRQVSNTDLNPYGANTFLAQEVEEWKLDKTLRMAQDAGLGWLKQQFAWEEIEPSQGSYFVPGTLTSSWAKYDKIVDASAKYGLQIIARVDRPPAWARPAATSGRGPIENYSDYGDFIYAFVKHFSGRIRYVQVWNEPNLYYEWGGVEPNARDYVTLLRLAYRRAKEADPNVIILSAPLAPTLERSVQAYSDLDYLQQMYDEGARSYFDVLAANAFGQAMSPEDPPDPTVLNFQRVVLLRQIMEKNGDGGKAVWINEFGWNAAPDDFAPEKLTWARVSEQTQADYTIRGLRIARSWDWVGVINIWYLRHVGNISPDSAEYYFRMIDVDFTPRLIYRALKTEIAQAVAGQGFYEETAPGVKLGSGWNYELVSAASGGQHLVTANPGADVTISFQGSSLAIVAAHEPGAGSISVTIDGQAANALPKDKTGQTYLDLSSTVPHWQVETTVATNLRAGAHTALIVHGGQPGRVTLDAYIVGNSTASRPFSAMLAVCAGLAICADAAMLWRETKKRRAPSSQGGS